eukprot:CCRYP_000094-RA/>CCRYP_000094-RA protein AED:0.83 eAED:0.85 QI:0/0/0/1/0/0/2/0/80
MSRVLHAPRTMNSLFQRRHKVRHVQGFRQIARSPVFFRRDHQRSLWNPIVKSCVILDVVTSPSTECARTQKVWSTKSSVS